MGLLHPEHGGHELRGRLRTSARPKRAPKFAPDLMDMDTDVDADAWLVLPAALFTLLALLTAALFLNKKYVPRSSREEHKPTRPQGALASCTGHGNTARSQVRLGQVRAGKADLWVFLDSFSGQI